MAKIARYKVWAALALHVGRHEAMTQVLAAADSAATKAINTGMPPEVQRKRERQQWRANGVHRK